VPSEPAEQPSHDYREHEETLQWSEEGDDPHDEPENHGEHLAEAPDDERERAQDPQVGLDGVCAAVRPR
jgi:hypothetical protein